MYTKPCHSCLWQLEWRVEGNSIKSCPNIPITPAVIYGQDVLYAARGQDARSRPAKAGIQWFIQYIPAQAGMTRFLPTYPLRPEKHQKKSSPNPLFSLPFQKKTKKSGPFSISFGMSCIETRKSRLNLAFLPACFRQATHGSVGKIRRQSSLILMPGEAVLHHRAP